LLIWLRKVILQDAPHLAKLCPDAWIWKNELFQSAQYQRWKEQALELSAVAADEFVDEEHLLPERLTAEFRGELTRVGNSLNAVNVKVDKSRLELMDMVEESDRVSCQRMEEMERRNHSRHNEVLEGQRKTEASGE
jgi:hypothetical protein